MAPRKKKEAALPRAETVENTYSILNPLKWLNPAQADEMIEQARYGRISRLSQLFELVEAASPTLQMVIQRRALTANDWTISPRTGSRFVDVDKGLVKAQSEYLFEQFSRAEDDGTLFPAIKTLEMATFRGLGVVSPLYDKDGLFGFDIFHSFNFAIDPKRTHRDGSPILLWNPMGTDTFGVDSLEEIPQHQIIARHAVPIDRYGLLYFLAERLGFESYTSLIARKGLPAAIITAPEGLADEDMPKWAHRAAEVAKGGSGSLPYGSMVQILPIDSGNATSIKEFCEWSQKQIVVAATAGSLASLTDSTGMNSDIASVQNKVFENIKKQEAFDISDLINRRVVRDLLSKEFPNKPQAVYFSILGEEKPSPKEVLENAVMAHNAGLDVDADQLTELTGLTLKKSAISVVSPYASDAAREVAEEAAKEEAVTNSEAPEVPTEPTEPTKEEAVKKEAKILKAMDVMLKPLRHIINRMKTAKTKDECEALSAEAKKEIAKLEEQDETALQAALLSIQKEKLEGDLSNENS